VELPALSPRSRAIFDNKRREILAAGLEEKQQLQVRAGALDIILTPGIHTRRCLSHPWLSAAAASGVESTMGGKPVRASGMAARLRTT
jgi:hypothetical protein